MRAITNAGELHDQNKHLFVNAFHDLCNVLKRFDCHFHDFNHQGQLHFHFSLMASLSIRGSNSYWLYRSWKSSKLEPTPPLLCWYPVLCVCIWQTELCKVGSCLPVWDVVASWNCSYSAPKLLEWQACCGTVNIKLCNSMVWFRTRTNYCEILKIERKWNYWKQSPRASYNEIVSNSPWVKCDRYKFKFPEYVWTRQSRW